MATIQRTYGDRHRFAVSDREAYKAVRANYFDVKQGKRGVVMVKEKTAKQLREQLAAKQKAANELVNSAEPVFTITHTYASRAKAGAKLILAKGTKDLTTTKPTNTSGGPDALPATTDKANAPTFNDACNVLTLRHSYGHQRQRHAGRPRRVGQAATSLSQLWHHAGLWAVRAYSRNAHQGGGLQSANRCG